MFEIIKEPKLPSEGSKVWGHIACKKKHAGNRQGRKIKARVILKYQDEGVRACEKSKNSWLGPWLPKLLH